MPKPKSMKKFPDSKNQKMKPKHPLTAESDLADEQYKSIKIIDKKTLKSLKPKPPVVDPYSNVKK